MVSPLDLSYHNGYICKYIVTNIWFPQYSNVNQAPEQQPGLRCSDDSKPKGISRANPCWGLAGKIGGYIGVLLGLHKDNGKSNGNYYIIGLFWGYIGILEKKMETTII